MEVNLEFGVVILVLVVVAVVAFKGVIQAFQRNAIVAILCVIFLFPIFVIWAIAELFLPKPQKTEKVVIVERSEEK